MSLPASSPPSGDSDARLRFVMVRGLGRAVSRSGRFDAVQPAHTCLDTSAHMSERDLLQMRRRGATHGHASRWVP
jgi:hypothetical protein